MASAKKHIEYKLHRQLPAQSNTTTTTFHIYKKTDSLQRADRDLHSCTPWYPHRRSEQGQFVRASCLLMCY